MSGVDRFEFSELVETGLHLFDQLVQQPAAIGRIQRGPGRESRARRHHRAIDIFCTRFGDGQDLAVIKRIAHAQATTCRSFEPMTTDEEPARQARDVDELRGVRHGDNSNVE